MENNEKKILGMLGDRAKEFVTKPGQAYFFQGRRVDLRTVDIRTAEALANSPDCSFLQWADPSKRPANQRDPLPAGPSAGLVRTIEPGSSGAKSDPSQEPGAAKASEGGTDSGGAKAGVKNR